VEGRVEGRVGIGKGERKESDVLDIVRLLRLLVRGEEGLGISSFSHRKMEVQHRSLTGYTSL